MEERKTEKTLALIIAVVVILVYIFSPFNVFDVGLYYGCGLGQRLAYSFFHTNIFHLIINLWCFLYIAFLCRISLFRLFFAYVIAVTIPLSLLIHLSDLFFQPSVGLSAIVFFLLGSMSFEVSNKWRWQKWMIPYLLIGLLLPNVNGVGHLYCYTVGVFYSLISKLANGINR